MARAKPLKTGYGWGLGLLLGGVLVCALPGCSSPQIPLPPPVIEDLSFALSDAGGSLGQLSGSGENSPEMGNSAVRVINLRDHHGVITPAADDGSFETRPFEARDGDELQVDYTLDHELSEGLCITVRHAGPLSLCGPPADSSRP